MRRAVDGSVVTHLDVRPLDTPHRPSVDVLFQSAADVYAGRVLGVVMTGMGARRPRGRGLDQGKRGADSDRSGGDVRRLRHAPFGRRGRTERLFCRP